MRIRHSAKRQSLIRPVEHNLCVIHEATTQRDHGVKRNSVRPVRRAGRTWALSPGETGYSKSGARDDHLPLCGTRKTLLGAFGVNIGLRSHRRKIRRHPEHLPDVLSAPPMIEAPPADLRDGLGRGTVEEEVLVQTIVFEVHL